MNWILLVALLVVLISVLELHLTSDLASALVAAVVAASVFASMAASTVVPLILLSSLGKFLNSRVGDVLLSFAVGFFSKLATIQTFPHDRYVAEDSTS